MPTFFFKLSLSSTIMKDKKQREGIPSVFHPIT